VAKPDSISSNNQRNKSMTMTTTSHACCVDNPPLREEKEYGYNDCLNKYEVVYIIPIWAEGWEPIHPDRCRSYI